MNFEGYNDFIENLEPAASQIESGLVDRQNETARKFCDLTTASLLGTYRFLIAKTPGANPKTRAELFIDLAAKAAVCAEEEAKTGHPITTAKIQSGDTLQ